MPDGRQIELLEGECENAEGCDLTNASILFFFLDTVDHFSRVR